MKPFLEVPICIVNTEDKEKKTTAKMQPGEIAYYYPGFNWGTIVVMKSGSSMLVDVTEEEFTAGLDLYEQHIKKLPGKFGTLTLQTKKPLHATN